MAYSEVVKISKKNGKTYIVNNIWGACELIDKKELKEQLEGNECFVSCDKIKESKYKFYVDYEVADYFAIEK